MAEFNPNNLNLNAEQPKKDLGSIPFDDSDGPETKISHAPLNLGGSGGSAPAVSSAAKPVSEPAARPAAAVAPKPVAPRPAAAAKQPAPGERITKVKIFFTKLHAGALDFMAEQIAAWLAANPDVVIKRTNIVVGEIAAKVTEQNLIISIWY
jgi:hypothetical protein